MPFNSTGTVSISYGADGPNKAFLTPAEHHMVEHVGQKYAVFVSWASTKPVPAPVPADAKVLPLEDNHIEINVDDHTPASVLEALSQAAAGSIAVDITVQITDSRGKARLRGAIVPALVHKK